MVVKYQVERRPIGPDGTVYYGKERGNGVAVLSDSNNDGLKAIHGPNGNIADLAKTQSTKATARYIPMNREITPNGINPTTGAIVYSEVVEQQGEPWLVYSQHHSLDAAIASAAPIAGAIGANNVRIIKVLSHAAQFKLN